MPIRMPDLKSTRCQCLQLCGYLDTENQSLLNSMGDHFEGTAVWQVERGPIWLKLLWGASDKHFHLELATSEFSGDEGRPETTHTQPEVETLINRIMGERIKVRVLARYVIRTPDLPERGLIRWASCVETYESDFPVRLTGATVEIRGAPLYALQWCVSPDAQNVTVDLFLSNTTTAGDTYLLDGLSLAELAFQLFVLGQPLNEASKQT